MAKVDPGKLKALLKDSQTSMPDQGDEEAADGEDTEDTGVDEETDTDEQDDGDDGDGEELTVETLTEQLKPAVATINEIVDEFRTGTDAQPKAGVETLEETEGLNAEEVHAFCGWTEDAGKKDFRALGEALDLEDVDGFVGWCRAVRRMQEDGDGEETMDDEGESDDAQDESEDGSDESGDGEEQDGEEDGEGE